MLCWLPIHSAILAFLSCVVGIFCLFGPLCSCSVLTGLVLFAVGVSMIAVTVYQNERVAKLAAAHTMLQAQADAEQEPEHNSELNDDYEHDEDDSDSEGEGGGLAR